jgi:ATP-dependent Zn protease
MLDQIMTTLIAILGVILILGAMFLTWVLWTARESIMKAIRVTIEQAKKAKNESYSREELVSNIRFSENRGNNKAAAHWRELLERKYPEEPRGENA